MSGTNWRPWTDADVDRLHSLIARGWKIARVAAGIPPGVPRSMAEQPAARRRAVTLRSSLYCRKPFESEWIGNRLCDPCKATAAFAA